ncbi:MAG: hypothetical protein ACK4WH_11265, partial [Phycisphaerales bacterium]
MLKIPHALLSVPRPADPDSRSRVVAFEHGLGCSFPLGIARIDHGFGLCRRQAFGDLGLLTNDIRHHWRR